MCCLFFLVMVQYTSDMLYCFTSCEQNNTISIVPIFQNFPLQETYYRNCQCFHRFNKSMFRELVVRYRTVTRKSLLGGIYVRVRVFTFVPGGLDVEI